MILPNPHICTCGDCEIAPYVEECIYEHALRQVYVNAVEDEKVFQRIWELCNEDGPFGGLASQILAVLRPRFSPDETQVYLDVRKLLMGESR